VTRGQLPQRAGSLGLNGGGAAAAVPPVIEDRTVSRVQKLCQVTIPVLHRDVQLAKECNVLLKHFGFLPLIRRCRALRICEER